MKTPEQQGLTEGQDPGCFDIEEMEERMEMQAFKDSLVGPDFCIYFACTDVCPPNG